MDKLKALAWIIGTALAVIAFSSYGLWFWISKSSWVSTSWAPEGIYTHCLDFKFRRVTIGGSIVTNFVPHGAKRTVGLYGNGYGVILAAVTFEQEFFTERLAQIDKLRATEYISIFEGFPIANHIPDMDFKDENGNLLGTVSFTLWPDKITTLVDRMVANFKSTKDISIEQKVFIRSVKKTEDERCLME